VKTERGLLFNDVIVKRNEAVFPVPKIGVSLLVEDSCGEACPRVFYKLS
jgi:hypothetical protein